jgi:hypothetical protein
MLTKSKLGLAALAVIGSASVAAAQYDGDGNLVPGAHQRGAIVENTLSFGNAFAAARPSAQTRRQLDGDGNPIPGGR